MISRVLIIRLVIFAFLILAGYALAQSISIGNLTGLVLAAVSLLAGILFIHLISPAKR